jgi:hypothetical protein
MYAPNFHIRFVIWAKFGIKVLHVISLIIGRVCRSLNRDRRNYIYAYTLKLYSKLKIKNALLYCVQYVLEHTIYSHGISKYVQLNNILNSYLY